MLLKTECINETWQLVSSLMLGMRILKKGGFEKSKIPSSNTKMSFRFGSYKNKNWSSAAVLILQYCFSFSEFRSLPSFSPCFSDNDSMYEHMSHCLASASLFHTLTKMESELWEALQGGMALGLERSTALIWRQFTPTVRTSLQSVSDRENYPSYLIHDECVCYCYASNVLWLFIELCYEQCPNKKWKNVCIHLDLEKESIFLDIAYAHQVINLLYIWSQTMLSAQ